ncbi:hypothetical protein LCGC14_2851200, partial [marine sediment metagenome]
CAGYAHRILNLSDGYLVSSSVQHKNQQKEKNVPGKGSFVPCRTD